MHSRKYFLYNTFNDDPSTFGDEYAYLLFYFSQNGIYYINNYCFKEQYQLQKKQF